MKTFIKSFLADESGASAAEYALILVVIGVAIITGGLYLGSSIGQAMEDSGDCIADPVADDGTANAICN
jgi:pilus assembly protein Flp/PilA